ncbi:S41 family peptidase [Shewanella corallii]|uniref:S41 family peptidase n=1 Tax=Shewanella corallii TaxID=560080 RepID=A0ABT0NF95_9GAMM|nr:S41 family peptidase [Shewanella corallii]MCL2916477.1 S41 family peptidase [Shewanella corallii]
MLPILRYISCIVFGLMLGLSITLAGKEHATPSNHYNFPLLMDVIETVETYYVDQIDREELIDAAIEGIFSKLDPYSTFLEHQDLVTLRESNRGEYFGFGFEIATEDDSIRIVTPFPSSPAERAGIKAGDTIVSLNSKPRNTGDLNGLLEEIRDASLQRRTINMELKHQGTGSAYQVTLTPEVIQVQSVSSEILDEQIGYIRLSSFQDTSAAEMKAVVQQWQTTPLQGIVLDLRNNPGGLLEQAIQIADLFLDGGRIVSTEGRFFDANSDYFAAPEHYLGELPILVLINKGSASAAEVLAGALQDNTRATIMGEQSFGKGTVQSLIPTLYSGNAVKLTIARYTTPKGEDIHAKGIQPDILFPAEGVAEQNNVHIIGTQAADAGHAVDSDLQLAISWITQQD